ncbi:aspartate-semialdehyde dehydrogenase [Serpentinicella alkaliphila]|uniref:Aspartate-semialdehyde dehydrogenase n=1 Tax=Serpentinicella alkaliphila TaxID=1734049 RepID=A0A4R2TDG3_9FIRM|nr:aspartate-semialdehyde dehydrogenase [Serpentinicella alkaliphila]QUH26971.1 aspartate-semialdehyde dehydrogenase [Serpentinicella alkaliphila]TCQ00566.1 aspartate semialdehyde dehydrogenase [Serpentinicella alkaliphila]
MGLIVGVVGATGAVGRKMLEVLEERNIDIEKLRVFASARSAGEKINFKDQVVTVELLTEEVMKDKFDYLLFSAGGSVSAQYAPIAAEAGNTVIDNSSQWRMTEGIPLVVPEVNAHVLKGYKGIIANPNCSTIQMVVALAPLHKRYGIDKVVVSTYQAVSGSGHKAIVELENQMKDANYPNNVYPKRIATNCIPHIDVFNDNGFTKEELKMVYETQKILEDNKIKVNSTTVRIPVFFSHSESVYVEFKETPEVSEVKQILSEAPGVIVLDNPEKNEYPTPLEVANSDDTYVGRIRKDLFNPNALSMWVVADNLRKGAATNAVQILEALETLK